MLCARRTRTLCFRRRRFRSCSSAGWRYDVGVLSHWRWVGTDDGEQAGDPEQLAVVYENERVTYGQLVDRIKSMAKGLQDEWAVGKGDVVLFFAPNSVDWIVAFHATLLVGGIASLANPAYTAKELKAQAHDGGIKYCFTTPALEPVAREALEGMDAPVALFGTDEFRALSALSGSVPAPVALSSERTAVLPYSSGTTGLPKGVELTHANLIANVMQTDALKREDLTEDDVLICALPLFHVYGLMVLNIFALYKHMKVAVMGKFDLPEFLRLLQDEKVTYAHVAPPICVALAKHPIVDKYKLSLRVLFSGAAPLGSDTQAQLVKRLGCTVLQGYGMSELSPVSHVGIKDYTKSGSVGFLLPNQEMHVLDLETGKRVPPGTEGEIVIKGPNVMKGYWRNEAATKETMTADGFLRTGDIGVVSEDGQTTIVGRVKELIKVSGWQVAPAELENLLLNHDKVADAAVIGVPNERTGELPRAYVVLKQGQTATEEPTATDRPP